MAKKTRIRIGIVLVIVGVMSFSDRSFAVEDNLEIGSIVRFLDFAVSILSWIWILFAKLAGEFLTNKWVYGEIVGLDRLLWTYRNVMKNIANFCLGFYFVYMVFRGLISKEDLTKKIKNGLLWILIAGVGIQASWFLTAAMIDVSTITLVAVGSFPSQIVSQNKTVEDGIQKSMYEYFSGGQNVVSGKIYDLFPKDGKANSLVKTTQTSLETPEDKEKFFDSLLPSAEEVSGPLYYMGFAILKTDRINSLKSSSEKGLKESVLNLIIQGGTTIIYSIEMAVLCVLALMRIIYLWMFIVLSPLAILIECIKRLGEKSFGEKGFLGDLMKQINLKSFLINVFKPTIVVLGIGLAMIFATLMNSIINGNNGKVNNKVDIGGVVIETSEGASSIDTGEDKSYTTTIKSDLLTYTLSYAGKGLLDFMLSIITVILVYMIIQVAVKMGGGNDFVSQKIGNIQDSVGNAMTSLPVMPVAGYDKYGDPTTNFVSAGSVFGLGGKKSILEKKIATYADKTDVYGKEDYIIQSRFGNNTGYLTSEEKSAIENVGKDTSKVGIDKLNAIKSTIPMTDEGKGMKLDASSDSSKFWMGQFRSRLDNAKIAELASYPIWKNMVTDWQSEPDTAKRSLETLFKNSEYAKAYAEFFFEEGDKRRNITSWDRLKIADISKNKNKEKDDEKENEEE